MEINAIGYHLEGFYIQDVIAKPEYQKKGIGLEMMKHVMGYIEKTAYHHAVVGLMAAKEWKEKSKRSKTICQKT